jgi:hypothetical protein
VKIIYLPENLTAKPQPLDKGIVFSVKARYKASLAKEFVYALNHWEEVREKESTGNAGVKEGRLTNAKDMVELTDPSWKETRKETIVG